MFQDLKSMHGLDAEQELMDLMAMELQLEIDREVISRVNTTSVKKHINSTISFTI
jgi:hypothetical protein